MVGFSIWSTKNLKQTHNKQTILNKKQKQNKNKYIDLGFFEKNLSHLILSMQFIGDGLFILWHARVHNSHNKEWQSHELT